MSLPAFSEIDPEITRESALNMILASIAMEELALSHIINAEGEKIQYVLDLLKMDCKDESNVNKILEVNRSVAELLESVSQNQMLLKNKMDKVLRFFPENPPNCSPTPKCSAVFKGPKSENIWCNNHCLPWTHECIRSKCFTRMPCDNTKIEVMSKGRFMVGFAINVKSKSYHECGIAVNVQTSTSKRCLNTDTFYWNSPHPNTLITLSASGIIAESPEKCNTFSLALELAAPSYLIVESSMLSIAEI